MPREKGGMWKMADWWLDHIGDEGAKDLLTKPPESLLWLKGKVRNASRNSQRALYDYLHGIFEGEP